VIEPAAYCQFEFKVNVSTGRVTIHNTFVTGIRLRSEESKELFLIHASIVSKIAVCSCMTLEATMAARAKLKRKSYFVDERALRRAKKALGVKTEAEVIRLSVERVAEMEEFWEFMKKTRRSVRPGSLERS